MSRSHGGNVWRKLWRNWRVIMRILVPVFKQLAHAGPNQPTNVSLAVDNIFLKMAALILQRCLGIVYNPCNLKLTVFKIYIQETGFEIMMQCRQNQNGEILICLLICKFPAFPSRIWPKQENEFAPKLLRVVRRMAFQFINSKIIRLQFSS